MDKYLVSVNIQDGENSYWEYYVVSDMEEGKEIVSGHDTYITAVKDSTIKPITEKEIKVLNKFGVV